MTSTLEEAGSAEEGAGVERPRALVVSGDPAFFELAQALLAQEGFMSRPAASGAAATEAFAESAPDLVLCDADPGGADARQLIERANALASCPAFILVTGLSDADEAAAWLRGSGVPHLVKPLDPSELSHAIAWLMHARHLRQRGAPVGDLAALYGIATVVNGISISPPLLERVLNLVLDWLGGDSGSIMLASAASVQPRMLSLAVSAGLRPTSRPGTVEFGQAVTGWVAARARPLRLVGSLTDYPQFREQRPNPTIAESLVVPMLWTGEVLGTICVSSKVPGRLGPEKLAMLVSVAEILGAALQRHRMERAREHQDRLAMLGQLAASLAHELNNPLAGLMANTAVLSTMMSEPDSQDLRNDVSAILLDVRDAVDRMTSLVGTLRGTSRKPTGELQEIDLDTLLRRAEILVHPQLKYRAQLVVERGAPPRIKADPGRITQILINLLVNASQVVGKDGLIHLRSRAEGSSAVIEVQDNGPGIPDEVAAHLFEPFFTTKPEGEGTGLGLSISRQIAREYGGDLTFRTRVGEGTCFVLKLPSAAAPEVLRPTILVVDDELALLNALDRVLRTGFKVHKAAGPGEALALAASAKIDLILTDYRLPGQTGLEMMRVLRERGDRTPAVLLTANASDSLEFDAAVREGLILRVLSKPWSTTTLAAELLSLLAATRTA
jgi:signal transduction histidine kinase/ActR/RegA family two-component response regulator